jgi:purine-nucleoside phosphorylase
MDDTYMKVGEATHALQGRSDIRPRIAIVLGSWLSPLASEVVDASVIPYDEIPHFPVSAIPAHPGRLVLGRIENQPVAVMSNRVHLYEGRSAQEVVFPVRVLQQLGAETLLMTNAAGAINTEYHVGTLMLIADHINFTGQDPLVGPNDPRLGPRYTDMSDAYSRDLRKLARQVAGGIGSPLAEGVYMGLLGPSFQTPAEVRMAKSLGADAVGMSTVLEVIAAKHAGMRVVAISCITDVATGTPPPQQEASPIPHEVLRQLAMLVRGIVSRYKLPSTTVDLERIITRRK